jgi:GT2 family glycosyltransferase/glycosyltransferase involved in cell wall biosynthesis
MGRAEHRRGGTSLLMTARPKVAIIVVNWNGLDDTRSCARSLLAQRYAPTQIYLVDNGSTDGSTPLLEGEFPAFTHIVHQTNHGFAIANNSAMKRALSEGANYILLLNNDTTVAPDFLAPLVETAEASQRVGMVVPKMYFHDRPDEIWFAGSRIRYDEWPLFQHIGEGEKDTGQYDAPGEPDFATGCCVLVRAALILDIGMLDPVFGYYCEDVDWSLRARRTGWRICYEPRGRIWHRVNRSMQRAQIDPLYYSYRNGAVVARRHLGWWRSRSVAWLAACSAWKDAHLKGNRAALIEAARDALIGRTGLVARPGSSLFARLATDGGRELFCRGIRRALTAPQRIVFFHYQRLRERPMRRARRAKLGPTLRIAINIDGQFQRMTGIQYYVDGLIGALLETDTHHEFTVFAPALSGSSLTDEHALLGGFGWRNHRRLRLESAGAERTVRGRNGAENEFTSASRRAREASRRYDLLHVPCPVPLPYEQYEARACIATIYDLTTRLFSETHDSGTIAAWERQFSFAQKRCARVLTISEHSRRDIIEHLRIDPARIDVVPLAPRASTRRMEDPHERDAALRAIHLDARIPFVLYAGQLEPRKNLERLMQAFAITTSVPRLQKHRLVLAGGCAFGYDARLRARAAELGLAERVHFTGYIPNISMNALMSACQAFAYISEYEGFGLPPLEAMACGAPVVSSNAASLPEVVGQAGILVHPHNVEEISAALGRLLSEPSENARLRDLALKRATHFTWARTAGLTLRAYLAAVASPKENGKALSQ